MSGTTRAERITQMLEEKMAKGKLKQQDFLEMQYDKKDILAEALAKSMLRIYENNKGTYDNFVQNHAEPAARKALEEFFVQKATGWNGSMEPDSQFGALYMEFLNHFYSMPLAAQIPHEKTRRIIYDGFYLATFWDKFFEGVANDKNYMKEICQYKLPPHLAFEGRRVETADCSQLILLGLVQAQRALHNALGSDTSKWYLSQVLKMKYEAAPFDEIPFFGRFFRDKQELGGSTHTVFLSYVYFVKNEVSVTSVGLEGKGSANYRQVVDLGRPNEAVFTSDSGQSESVFSPHFFDLNPKSNSGKNLMPMILDEADSKRTAKSTVHHRKPAALTKTEL